MSSRPKKSRTVTLEEEQFEAVSVGFGNTSDALVLTRATSRNGEMKGAI